MAHVILLVDDIESNVLLLEKLLESAEYQFIRAKSGEEALLRAKGAPVSLAILDVNMPGMDGYELARRLGDVVNTPRLPIIFVTAEACDERSVFGGYEAGAIDYLVKPVDPRILQRKVRLLCELVEKERSIKGLYEEAELRNAELTAALARQRQLEEDRAESETRYQSLMTLSPVPVVVQVNGAMVFYNASAIQLLGLPNEDSAPAQAFHELVDASDRESVREKIEEIVRRGGRSGPLPCRLRSGCYVELSIGCILYGGDIGVQMAIQDVTPHKIVEQELTRLSQMDGLTGVTNRRALDQAVAVEWKRSVRTGKPLSVIMIDIDQFKAFNDHYGHLSGDECLKRVAREISAAARRPADVAARYGGEEFTLLLPDTTLVGACHIAADLVLAIPALKIPHERNRDRNYVSISCGVATRDGGGGIDSASELFHQADLAMYSIKTAGGDGYSAGRREMNPPEI